MTKNVYETPSMEELGSFEEITQSQMTGTVLDVTEPAGTPLDELTLS